MLKKIAALLMALFTFAAFAAVDVNKATQAELDAIKGIGPGIAGKILDERKKGSFKDWTDLVDRVKGVGEGNAAKFSAEGLTVNGSTFKGMAAAPAKAAPAKADAAAKPAKEEKAAKPMKDEKATTAAAKDAKPAKEAKEAKPAAAKAGDKVETVKGAAKEAANDAKAKPMEAVGAKK